MRKKSHQMNTNAIYYAEVVTRSIEKFCSQNQNVQIHHKMERGFFLVLYENIFSLAILRTPGIGYVAILVKNAMFYPSIDCL